MTPHTLAPRGIQAGDALYCQGRPTLVAAARPRIEADLRRVVRAIRGKGRRVDAVVLAGSVGRNEGGLWEEGGQPVLLSDYDIFVLSGEALPPAFFRDLEPRLARVLWAPKVSIGTLATEELPGLPAALWTYDLRYGSQVLEGDPAVLDRLPAYRPEQIQAWEGLKLLCNYAGVLLRAAKPGGFLGREADRSLRQALIRLAYRIGDALAIREGCYHHLLARRPEALERLAAFHALPREEGELILWACREKLIPREWLERESEDVARLLFPLAERVLRESFASYLGMTTEALPALLAAYRRQFRVRLTWKGRVLANLARLRRGDPYGLPWGASATEPFHYLLAVLPLVLLATPGILDRSAYLREACRLLGDTVTWEACRERALRLWAVICLGEADAQ